MKLKNVDLKKLQAEIEPGPWKFGRHQMAIYSVPSGRTICATPVLFLNADAQAIALVPEMIARILELEEALKSLSDFMALEEGDGCDKDGKDMATLVDKVLGTQARAALGEK